MSLLPVREAGVASLPWLGEMIVSIRWMFRQEEHHVVAEVGELETHELDHRAELQRVFRIGHLESRWKRGV